MKEGKQKKEYEEASRFKQPQKKAREPCKYRVKNEERSLERNRQLVPVSSISKEKNNGAALPICRREVPTRSPKVSTWGTRGGHEEDTKGTRGGHGTISCKVATRLCHSTQERSCNKNATLK